jgi:hypothetical protein
MRRLRFARALSERRHHPRPFVIRHGQPACDLIARPETTGANIASAQLANVDAW